MLKVLVIVLAIVLVLWLIPLALIWCFNALFHVGIIFGWKTWLAALLLALLLGSSNASRSK